jgi:hypothetical protein
VGYLLSIPTSNGGSIMGAKWEHIFNPEQVVNNQSLPKMCVPYQVGF